MELTVLEQETNRIRFTLQGAGHTFCNLFKTTLYEDKNVDTAAYAVNHPLIGTPTFIVEKHGNTGFPTILANTAKHLKTQNEAFATAFKKLK